MAKLSISQAWDETRAILARDGKLIAAVALALFVLPGVVLNVAVPEMRAGEMRQVGPWMLIALAVLLISMVGQLSVVRLSMGPPITVGEAIAHGLRRLPSYAGAFLMWTVPLLVVISLLYTLAGPQGSPQSSAVAIGLLAMMVVGIYVGVRLVLLSAVASAETGGPIAILRRSWELSRGNWWRLFGFVVTVLIAGIVVLWAIGSTVGLLAKLAFGDVSPLSVGGLIVVIVAQLLSAAISVILLVMIARLYTQRAGAQAGVPNSGI
jgi:Membrane domain of glycerophosphoryl diester phosphodiesterase